MTVVDSGKRQLVCKVAFAGALDAGVGTTFRELRTLVPGGPDAVVIPSPDAPPIYELRYRPRPLIRRQGLDLVLHLVGYEEQPAGKSFQELLSGADGLVLLVDSSPAAMEDKRAAIGEIEAAFQAQGVELEELAVMLQYNKRDLPDALPIRHLEAALNQGNWPYVATSSHRAQGLQQLLDRLTAVVARNARPPRSWSSGRAASLRPGFAAEGGPEEEQTQLYGQRRPRAGALDRADQRLFGRARPRGGWLDPDEDRTVLADERPSAGSELTELPAAGADSKPATIGPELPVVDHSPPAEDPGAAELEPAPASSPEVAPDALVGGATRPHTVPPGSIAPPARPHAPAEGRQDDAPWDSRGDQPVATGDEGEPVPKPASGVPPAPEIINIRVPALARHRPTGLGRPQIRGPRSIDLPFTANVDGQRQDVVLRMELGAPYGAETTATPTSSARRDGGAQMVPLSWLLFAAGLLLVVIVALLLGSLD